MSYQQEIRLCMTSDGVRIAYATAGHGPPLVKAANWLSHLEYDWQSPVWRHWLAELSAHHTLVRYDERGCGLSDWDVGALSVETWVSDLEAVVDAQGLERFPLLGMSQGGPVAITYAVRHPERVSHLILYGTYARGRHNRDARQEEREVNELLMQMMRVGWGKDNPAFRQVFTTLFIPEAKTEQMRWFNDLQRVSASTENAIKIRSTNGDIDVVELAQQVSVPTLVLHAREDALVPFEEARILAALIPGARFVPLEGKNHILLADEPAWEHFLAEVRTFVGVGADATAPGVAGDAELLAELTEREVEVLDLIARGLTNEEIAEHLVISPKTVRNHITSIFSKMGVTHRAQAIVRAREVGLGAGSADSL